ncbi:hypothetical protein AVEN_99932-1 [Araneus ventricosus]|uniref:Uncharacterized protein n=1 Tax=Araneus ventricosus TaxID=182803 RepID=A0A4Y2MAH5_ARAVE|nr:hypothetical protein AVEN_99932-1 [Araneus ventricosus]
MSTVQHQARLAVSGSTKPTVQSHFRLEYRNCRSPSKNSIRSWYQKFKGTGDMYYKKGTGRPSVSDEDVKRRLSLLSCLYKHLMDFFLGDRQFRCSNRKHL